MTKPPQGGSAVSTADEVVMLKGPWHYGAYQRLFGGKDVRKIVAFGISEGGSALMLADMFPDAKIVVAEAREANPAVTRHLDRLGLADRVKLYFGTPQSDPGRLPGIIRDEFGAAVDLVIDECGADYAQTKATFEMAFPLVRPGGHYAFEDWDRSPPHSPSYKTYDLLVGDLTPPCHPIVEVRVVRGLASFEKGGG